MNLLSNKVTKIRLSNCIRTVYPINHQYYLTNFRSFCNNHKSIKENNLTNDSKSAEEHEQYPSFANIHYIIYGMGIYCLGQWIYNRRKIKEISKSDNFSFYRKILEQPKNFNSVIGFSTDDSENIKFVFVMNEQNDASNDKADDFNFSIQNAIQYTNAFDYQEARAKEFTILFSIGYIIQLVNYCRISKAFRTPRELIWNSCILGLALYWSLVVEKSPDISLPYNKKTFSFILTNSEVISYEQYQNDLEKYKTSKKMDPEEWLSDFNKLLNIKNSKELNLKQ